MRAFRGQTLSDPVGLPVVMFMASLFGIVASPLVNALIREDEMEADRYSLETVNLPDALVVRTGEDRGVSKPAAHAARGGPVLRPPFGRKTRAYRDGVEGRAPGATPPETP